MIGLKKIDKKSLIKSFIIISIMGVLFHYFYDLFNQNKFIGLIFPHNESVFEHLKLVLVPNLIYYSFIKKEDKNSFYLGLLVSIVLSMSLIIVLYYFFKLFFESIIIDISIYFVSIFVGQILFYYISRKDIEFNYRYSFNAILLLVILFIILQIYTPNKAFFR